MRYTKIITLTGSGLSGSVRIEGSNNTTRAQIKLRRPESKKLVLFLLSGEHADRVELSKELSGQLPVQKEIDAALLAADDNGTLRFIAEGRSLGCKTDLERIKRDIRFRQKPAIPGHEPGAEKQSLKTISAGEHKKTAPEQAHADLKTSGEELLEGIPQTRVPMPATEIPESDETVPEQARTDFKIPGTELLEAIPQTRVPMPATEIPERDETGPEQTPVDFKTPGAEPIEEVPQIRVPIPAADIPESDESAPEQIRADVKESGKGHPEEAPLVRAIPMPAAEIPEPETGSKGEAVHKTETAPAVETEQGSAEVPGGKENKQASFRPAEPSNIEAEEISQSRPEAEKHTGQDAAPVYKADSEPKNREAVERAIKEAETEPEGLRKSKALSDILNQARNLFPSGYDVPEIPQKPYARGSGKDSLKHLTPMQKNTKWDGEMEAVLNTSKGKEQAKEEPSQKAEKKDARMQSGRQQSFEVHNPFPETFPNSKWRKVTYPGTNRYYLEGEAAGANGVFRIAALPGEYSAVPPSRAKGFNRFIRASDGCGYWLRITAR